MRGDTVHVAIFAKAPVPGAVKTRLIPTIGADAAARLQQQLTTMTLARASALADAIVTLWVDGPLDDAFVCAAARRFGVALRPQQGHDLGARMHNAFDETLGTSKAMLLIGTDCPAQTPADLERARTALRDADAVVQPAEDGGYVLIGMRRPLPLFAGIPWGSDRVMESTRARAAGLGIVLAELPTSWDLDRPADLDRARRCGLIDAAFA
jgi:rSAM/selenodomain-associated transferase 1